MGGEFKWRHFAGEVILLCVRWYCRYGISYRDLEEMMGERGVGVDHTTLYRWVQRYAPELEKRTLWYQSRISFSWRVDETYIRVKGRWKYLYRAIDKGGATLDFYLADRRNAKAAKRFLAKALSSQPRLEAPGHQHRQEPRLRRGDRRAEEGRPAAERDPAPAGEVSQQPPRGRPRQAEALDQAHARLPVDEDGLCDDQGFRGDADVQEGPVHRLDRCDRRRKRGALHQPPVRPLCVSHRRDQAFTRRDRIFATVPDDLRPVLRALRRMAVDEAVKTGVLPPRSVDRRVQLEGREHLFYSTGWAICGKCACR